MPLFIYKYFSIIAIRVVSPARLGSLFVKNTKYQLVSSINNALRLLCVLILGVGLIGSAQAYCPYCRKFDQEIASIYPKTDEGKRAPLRRHKIGDPLPDKYAGLDISASTLTPTFILIKDNKEIDRLVGYNGDEFFWYLLNDLLDSLEPSH